MLAGYMTPDIGVVKSIWTVTHGVLVVKHGCLIMERGVLVVTHGFLVVVRRVLAVTHDLLVFTQYVPVLITHGTVARYGHDSTKILPDFVEHLDKDIHLDHLQFDLYADASLLNRIIQVFKGR